MKTQSMDFQEEERKGEEELVEERIKGEGEGEELEDGRSTYSMPWLGNLISRVAAFIQP